MSVGEKIAVNEFNCEGHETKPPARYTEPTLVKKLEELGIGRPSTFASIGSRFLTQVIDFLHRSH